MTGGGNGGFNVYKYHYPKSRTAMAKDNVPVGVVGSVELLNSKVWYLCVLLYCIFFTYLYECENCLDIALTSFDYQRWYDV